MIKKSQNGFSIISVILISAILCIFAYIMSSVLLRGRTQMITDERQFLLFQMAANIKEIGKYLLFYEKVFFVKNPLKTHGTDNNEKARSSGIKKLLTQQFGEIDEDCEIASMINSCGGFDIYANYLGDNRIRGAWITEDKNRVVFCPLYLRNSKTNNSLLESMFFKNWINSSKETRRLTCPAGDLYSFTKKTDDTKEISEFLTSVRDGEYKLELDFKESIINTDNNSDDKNYIHLRPEKTDNENFSAFLKNLYENGKDFKVSLTYYFYTDSSGFTSNEVERFVKIESKIEFFNGLRRSIVEDTEEFVMQPSSIKDFVIFMPYPTYYNAAGKWEKTSSMKKALDLKSSSKIYGKVYFNGDMDIEPSNLPTFYDTVIISGNITVQFSDEDTLRNHFTKGIITNFSAERFLMDGALLKDGSCSTSTSKKTILNGTEISCNMKIKAYIDKLANVCRELPVKLGNNKIKYTFTATDGTQIDTQGDSASCPDSDYKITTILSGGYYDVTVNQTGGVSIMSPVRKLTISNDVKIYGTIFGGHISGGENVEFSSLIYLHPGSTGIGSSDTFEEINKNAEKIYEGIGVPLLNFPLIRPISKGIN